MSEKITVTTREQAWAEANKIFPTDYDKDHASSERAGYDIYRHITLNPLNRICDLGNRLEVLTQGEHGETVINIWIIPKTETRQAKSIEYINSEQRDELVKRLAGMGFAVLHPHQQIKSYTDNRNNLVAE